MPASRTGGGFVRIPCPLALTFLLLLLGSIGDHAGVGRGSTSLHPKLPLISPADATVAHLNGSFDRLPMSFEANSGQTDESVTFLSRGNGYQVFLTPTEAVVTLSDPVQPTTRKSPFSPRSGAAGHAVAPSRGVLRLKLVGADGPKKVEGLHPLPGKSNYITGNDPSRWRTKVPTYATVQYTGVYPGIDLLYHGNQHQLEYDFVVAPGANPKAIRLDFEGVENLRVDETGDLVLQVAGREARHSKPVIYQESGEVRREISGGYVVEGAREVGFEVGSYDAERPLIIDPVLVYSTYFDRVHTRSQQVHASLGRKCHCGGCCG